MRPEVEEAVEALEQLKKIVAKIEHPLTEKLLLEFDKEIKSLSPLIQGDPLEKIICPSFPDSWPEMKDILVFEKYEDALRIPHNKLEYQLCISRHRILQTKRILEEARLFFPAKSDQPADPKTQQLPDNLIAALDKIRALHLAHRETERKEKMTRLEGQLRIYQMELKGLSTDEEKAVLESKIIAKKEEIKVLASFSDEQLINDRHLF